MAGGWRRAPRRRGSGTAGSPVFRDQRRPAAGDLRTGAVRGLDRGLLVLVPDQRPSERLAPETPRACIPSQFTAPRRGQPARKRLSGSMMQNSLPSGSASTTWVSLGSWPMSMGLAPIARSSATVPVWSSTDVVVRSKWIRFWPTFSPAAGRKITRKLVASVGTSSMPAPSTRGCSSAARAPRTAPVGSLPER